MLEDILVRAIDMKAHCPEDDIAAVRVTITFEMSPEQALKLSKAIDQETLHLALRGLAP